jgi:hypothetical protein
MEAADRIRHALRVLLDGGGDPGMGKLEQERTPAPTASKVSNARTSTPAGNTSMLMGPPDAVPILCAKRVALD